MDPEVINRSDLFDVFVNLPDNEINIAQHAKGKTFKSEQVTHDVLCIYYSLHSDGKIGVDWHIIPAYIGSVKNCCYNE